MQRQKQWFLPGEGIAREVITSDIQQYLGPDALVRPGYGTGEHEGQPGYWITAYRTFTTQMVLDLKQDSQRWQSERQPGDGRRGNVIVLLTATSGSPLTIPSAISRLSNACFPPALGTIAAL
jgi:hypothetical protein